MPDTGADIAARRDLRNVPEKRVVPFTAFEFREKPNGTGGTDLTFSGYASVTDRLYRMEDWLGPYDERVRCGAFATTLSQNPDVMLLLDHAGMPFARTKSGTLTLAEHTTGDPTGLYSDARLAAEQQRVKDLRSAIERRDLDSMSFAFRVTRQEWSPDYDQRDILEVNLNQGDVSIVGMPANEHTAGTVSLRQRKAWVELRGFGLDRVVAAFREVREARAGAKLSADTLDVLTQVLGLVDDADTNVDNALIQLSDLMGVVNPDIAQDAALDRDDPGADTGGEDDDMQMNALWLMNLKNTVAQRGALRSITR